MAYDLQERHNDQAYFSDIVDFIEQRGLHRKQSKDNHESNIWKHSRCFA